MEELVITMVEHRAVYVASRAVLLACEQGDFRSLELRERLQLPKEDIPSDSTIRSILRELESEGWLERDHPQGRIWYASNKIQKI